MKIQYKNRKNEIVVRPCDRINYGWYLTKFYSRGWYEYAKFKVAK